MRWYIYKIYIYILEYLGRLFGHLIWQRWHEALTYPLVTLWANYNVWRKRRFYLINITGQIISLENFLNDEFDKYLRRIYIGSLDVAITGIYIALESEVIPYLQTPLENEVSTIEAPYIGAIYDFGLSTNFVVNVPIIYENNETQISVAVNNFKLAGKQFEIKFY